MDRPTAVSACALAVVMRRRLALVVDLARPVHQKCGERTQNFLQDPSAIITAVYPGICALGSMQKAVPNFRNVVDGLGMQEKGQNFVDDDDLGLFTT